MITAIIPAAGLSRRMGTNKLLLPFAGQTIIAHVVQQLRASRIDQIFLVTRHDSSALCAALQNQPVTYITNPLPDGDMLSSIRAALAQISPDTTALLLALADQPSITADLVDQLIAAFDADSRAIVVPTFNSRRGHPILFSARFRDEIMTSFDGTGLRGLLQAHADQIRELPVSHSSILHDIDFPEDYRRAMEQPDGR